MYEESIQIVNAKGVPGTIGAVVRAADNAWHFLTNHHVLYGGGAGTGDKVWVLEQKNGRRGFIEVGRTVKGQIGRVTHRGETVFVDCAIGAFVNEESLSGSLKLMLKALADVSGVAETMSGARVVKAGSASGRTRGLVVDVCYDDHPFIEGRRYKAPGQILIRSEHAEECFSVAGDSGAAVLDDQRRIVALLWGANANGEGIACPVGAVLECLGITIQNQSHGMKR